MKRRVIFCYEVRNTLGIVKVFLNRRLAERFQQQLVERVSKEERLRPVAWITEARYSA